MSFSLSPLLLEMKLPAVSRNEGTIEVHELSFDFDEWNLLKVRGVERKRSLRSLPFLLVNGWIASRGRSITTPLDIEISCVHWIAPRIRTSTIARNNRNLTFYEKPCYRLLLNGHAFLMLTFFAAIRWSQSRDEILRHISTKV
jgi:hypothetical protein